MDARRKMELVVDWRRQRAALERLRRGAAATWRPYDWDADDGSLSADVAGGPCDVVILDSAYSARPELADLTDLRVLLQVPHDVRRARLLQREEQASGRSGRPDGERPRTCTSARSCHRRHSTSCSAGPELGRYGKCSASTSANVRANVWASPGQRAETYAPSRTTQAGRGSVGVSRDRPLVLRR